MLFLKLKVQVIPILFSMDLERVKSLLTSNGYTFAENVCNEVLYDCIGNEPQR